MAGIFKICVKKSWDYAASETKKWLEAKLQITIETKKIEAKLQLGLK